MYLSYWQIYWIVAAIVMLVVAVMFYLLKENATTRMDAISAIIVGAVFGWLWPIFIPAVIFSMIMWVVLGARMKIGR